MRRRALLLGALLLAGCGFHPRGSEPFPQQFARIAVQNLRAGALLRTQVEVALESSGARLVAADQADAVLRLLDEEVNRRLLTVDSSGKASEYQVQYRVSFEVLGSKGEPLVGPESVVASRDYPYNRNNALAMEVQEEQLVGELRDQAVAQVSRRLRRALPPPAGGPR